MRFGVVIGVCVDIGEAQRASLASVARYCAPDTDLVLVFNGVAPFPVDGRYEVVVESAMLGREQGLWRYAYRIAVERGWDWCGTFHDDFYLHEAGWEAWTARAATTHKLGIVAYMCWPFAIPTGNVPSQPEFSIITGNDAHGGRHDSPPPGFLGVAVDGCGMAFNMEVFKPRRRTFTPLDEVCGYGEMEAGFWLLAQGWGCGRIPLSFTHHPDGAQNTRSTLQIGAGGLDATVRAHLDVLPAIVVDADTIRVGERGRMINVRREAS